MYTAGDRAHNKNMWRNFNKLHMCVGCAMYEIHIFYYMYMVGTASFIFYMIKFKNLSMAIIFYACRVWTCQGMMMMMRSSVTSARAPSNVLAKHIFMCCLHCTYKNAIFLTLTHWIENNKFAKKKTFTLLNCATD